MPTTNVLVTRTGTGFTIDVTPCDLDTDLTIKDFTIRQAGTQVPNTSYTKTNATTLTYTGAALPSNTQVEVRRKTPNTVLFTPRLGLRVRSEDWRREFDRVTRRAEEYELNGVGTTGGGAGQVLNDVYGVVWSGDTVYAPTRGSLYTKFESMAPLLSPALTGTPTAPTAAPSTNTTQIANTAFVFAGLALKADLASPALTGNPTVPTQLSSDNSTRIANTSFVQGLVSTVNTNLALKANIASPALTGTPSAPTPAYGTGTTQLATCEFVRTHEAWTSILPGGWSGFWRIRRRADGLIEMALDANVANVTLAAFATTATLVTLGTQFRPTNTLWLPSVIAIDTVGYGSGFITVSNTGAITSVANLAASNNTYRLRGTHVWSPDS